MLRLFLSTVLCLQVLGLEPLGHAPKKLTLTPGDLKRFSGHALNLIQAKCPKVKAKTLFDLNKFIGKEIAKDTEPLPGGDAAFRAIIDSMTACSEKSLKSLKTEKSLLDSDEGPDIFFFSPEGGDVVRLVAERDEKFVLPKIDGKIELPKIDAKIALPKVESKDFEKVKPISVKVQAQAAAPAIVKPVAALPFAASKPVDTFPTRSGNARSPFNDWISSVMSSVREFFHGMFNGRTRRDSDVQIIPLPLSRGGAGIVHHRVLSEDTSGKGSFTRLFTEVCRIYCDTCSGGRKRDFQIAANELLAHLFKIAPEQGLDLAAKHYLTKELMQTIAECE